MPDYNGVVQTARNSGGISNFLAGGRIDARVKCVVEQITLAGTEASGSTIGLFGNLPANANIVAFGLSVSAAQTSLTASLGDGASATRYASASTGLQTAVPTITWISGRNYVIGTNSGDNAVIITTGGATATAGILYAIVLYTTD